VAWGRRNACVLAAALAFHVVDGVFHLGVPNILPP
jgi:hypothetical protein